MPTLIDPTQGFSLADMPGDLPDNLPAGQQAPAEAASKADAHPPTPDDVEDEVEPDKDEPAAKPAAPAEPDEATNLNEAMDRQRKSTEDAEKEAAEVKKKEDEAA